MGTPAGDRNIAPSLRNGIQMLGNRHESRREVEQRRNRGGMKGQGYVEVKQQGTKAESVKQGTRAEQSARVEPVLQRTKVGQGASSQGRAESQGGAMSQGGAESQGRAVSRDRASGAGRVESQGGAAKQEAKMELKTTRAEQAELKNTRAELKTTLVE